MKSLSHFVLPVAIGLSLVSAASFAQTPPPPPKRERPSPEVMQRMQDGRIAMIVTALKMNDAQLKLWAPVEAKLRENQADRMKRMETMRGERQPGAAAPDLPDRMERMSKMMAEHAERSKAFAEVLKPFYATLSDDQKKVMGTLMKDGMRGKGGRGHGMHHGPGAGPR